MTGVDRITASFGVTEYSVDDSSGAIIARADKALYSAKTGGKNKVGFCFREEEDAEVAAITENNATLESMPVKMARKSSQ